MSIKIETYRGFEIRFEADRERFTFSLDETKWHEKQSYSACKKQIDEFWKEKRLFEPFKVKRMGTHFNDESIIEIISIRKDNRFVYKDDKGELKQLSDYSEKAYILCQDSDDKYFAEIAILKTEIDDIEKKIKTVKAKITAPTLEQLKKQFVTD